MNGDDLHGKYDYVQPHGGPQNKAPQSLLIHLKEYFKKRKQTTTINWVIVKQKRS